MGCYEREKGLTYGWVKSESDILHIRENCCINPSILVFGFINFTLRAGYKDLAY